MSRAIRLRLGVGVGLFPFAALLFADCGGNDVIDSADAPADRVFEGGTSDAAADTDAALPDAGGTFDGMGTGDAGAGGVDAGDASGVNASDASGGDAGAEGGVVAPSLGTARSFALLAGSTITNTGAATSIVGDVGVWPGTAITGPTAGQVTGTIHLGDPVAMQAEADMATAYNNLAARPCQHTMTSIDLGGKTLPPGVYCFAVAAVQMVGNLMLDGQGDPNAVWIFQIASTLTISMNLATVMINQGNACNVYWQVGSSATINGGAQLKGNILAQASISLLTGSRVSPGRALAQAGAVTMDTVSISNAGCP